MWLMKMSYRWFLFQCQPPVPRGFLFLFALTLDYEILLYRILIFFFLFGLFR